MQTEYLLLHITRGFLPNTMIGCTTTAVMVESLKPTL